LNSLTSISLFASERAPRALLHAALLLCASFGTCACQGEDVPDYAGEAEDPGAYDAGGITDEVPPDAGAIEETPTTECDPGDSRECKVTLGEHNGVSNCFVGVQTCEDDGSWSACHPDHGNSANHRP